MKLKKRYMIIIILLVSITASGYYSKNITPEMKDLQSKDALTYYKLAENYSHEYKYVEAVNSYKKAMQCNPEFEKAEIQFNLGWIYAELGKYDDAIKAYKKAIQNSESNTIAHMNLGMIYLHLNQKDRAMKEYKILKNLDKEKAKTFYAITSSLEKTT